MIPVPTMPQAVMRPPLDRPGTSTSEAIASEVLPLVAGLFVLVEALDRSGLLNALIHVLQTATDRSAMATTLNSSARSAFFCCDFVIVWLLSLVRT
jgi:Na+/H+ antiporter NhaD/arsenite permease-like protein